MTTKILLMSCCDLSSLTSIRRKHLFFCSALHVFYTKQQQIGCQLLKLFKGRPSNNKQPLKRRGSIVYCKSLKIVPPGTFFNDSRRFQTCVIRRWCRFVHYEPFSWLTGFEPKRLKTLLGQVLRLMREQLSLYTRVADRDLSTLSNVRHTPRQPGCN